MEQSTSLEEIGVWNPTSIRDHPERGEEQEVFRGETDGLSSPTPNQDDSTRDDAEAPYDFWSIAEDFIYRHHVEPRVKLHMPKEEAFPFPLKDIDVTRNTHTSLDVMQEKILMITRTWMEKGKLSDAWTGFTRFILSNERPLDGYTWSGGTLEQTNNLKKWQCLARYVEVFVWCSEKAMRSKSGLSRNQNPIIPDNYVVSSSLNQMMKNLNTPWKTLVESWKFRCQQQCFVEHQ